MKKTSHSKSVFLAGACSIAFASGAFGASFDIPGGDLQSALKAYSTQSGVPVVVSDATIKGTRTKGIKGEMPPDEALSRILRGTGFTTSRDPSGVIAIVPRSNSSSDASDIQLQSMQLAQAAPQRTAVETVTVTSSKLGGADVQSIPIAITALSQEQLTATQTAGGPDLVKQVPNLTFTKTNFTGYSIQIRGIGTQAISVTTDPAVAVALNDQPFIRNHFFEQEFYDLGQVEVLRGPQGTLYGRNATAGVVNLTTAKPTDQFEAMASGEIGNYHQRRFEGMVNLPIVDDRLDIRIAGEWTKRQGYSFNELTDNRTDGRDLWSGRVTVGFRPTENLQAYLIWEHFNEDDDRIRSSKQLCKTDPTPTEVGGAPVASGGNLFGAGIYLSQGCQMVSLYSPEAFEVPNGYSLPYYNPLKSLQPSKFVGGNPYASTTQSPNLRVIESTLDPVYKSKNDVVEFNADYDFTSALTLSSQTGFSHDFLYSTQDYNRFNTAPGVFGYDPTDARHQTSPDGNYACNDGTLSIGGNNCTVPSLAMPTGIFCDPQLGCSNRLVAEDRSDEHAWQLSQEFRLSSKFTGPLNFNVGGNFLHYETEENYYVFINSLTLFAAGGGFGGGNQLPPWNPGISDNHECLQTGFLYPDPQNPGGPSECKYLDPNPLQTLNGNGHNYFLSKNPYVLNSYAFFGEANYVFTPDFKLTAGLRWTDDRKHFTDIPSEVLVGGFGYPSTGVVDQEWGRLTGRLVGNWTPKLDFTDQTLIYGSYAHGYKAGGANPPGAVLLTYNSGDVTNPTHPLTFEPEYVDAFELGTKNTLLDGALTFNGNVFYYNYENYQISEIVDRTSINLNFDAHIKGAEVEATYEPIPGLRFNFGGGWEDTAIAKGEKAVDLMDRTAGNPDWTIVKPFVTQASNCIVPTYVIGYIVGHVAGSGLGGVCGLAYNLHFDPATGQPFTESPDTDKHGDPIPSGAYPGFDPYTAPNNGAGIDKDLSGNELPNAPHFMVSVGAQYSMPLSSNWAGTVRSDFYWQDAFWARVWNDDPFDRIHGYTNLNLTLIFTNQNGWQVMLYDKNVFNTTAITGTFLNSDDTGLTTNVFLTDPKLIGVRVTKNW